MPAALAEEGITSLRTKIATILTLALPAMTEQILQSLVGFVDILFVSRLGTVEVAAAGVANAFMTIYMAICFALGISASSLITRSIGAGDMVKARGVARQALFMSVLLGFLCGIITLFLAEPMLKLMGTEPAVLKEGSTYLRIVGIPTIFLSVMIVAGSIIRASGDTKTPMKVSFWINLLHIPLDYVLIFGIGSFAGWGVAGAAAATVLVRALGSIGLLISLKKSDLHVFSKDPDDTNLLRDPYTMPMLKLSVPVMVERLLMRLGVIIYYSVIINIGTNAYASHMIASNMEMVVILAGAGFEVASSILVGQHVGAGKYREARSFAMLNMGIAVGLMSLVGIALFFLAPWIAGFFTQDPVIIDMVTIALRFMGAYQPGLAILLILAGALQGSGDTKTPMYSTFIGMWLVRLVLIYIFGIRMNMGIGGVWFAITIDVYVRAIFLSFRFHQRFRRFERMQLQAKGTPA
ncbi:MAG: MATE family efflux transporter [Clostridia bacterium]